MGLESIKIRLKHSDSFSTHAMRLMVRPVSRLASHFNTGGVWVAIPIGLLKPIESHASSATNLGAIIGSEASDRRSRVRFVHQEDAKLPAEETEAEGLTGQGTCIKAWKASASPPANRLNLQARVRR